MKRQAGLARENLAPGQIVLDRLECPRLRPIVTRAEVLDVDSLYLDPASPAPRGEPSEGQARVAVEDVRA